MAEQRRHRTLVETPEYSAQRDAIAAKYSEEVIGPPLNGLLWGIATNPDQYDRATVNMYRALSRSLGLTIPVLRIFFGIENQGADDEHVLLLWIEEVEEMLGSLMNPEPGMFPATPEPSGSALYFATGK